MSHNILAIIPARGGSQRLPKKNIKKFFGKPVIAYPINAASACNIFDEICVSTDDLEIAKIAKKLGTKVPFIRSPKNSDDRATTFDVIQEVIRCYSLQKKTFKYACCIYPVTPLLTPERLIEGFNLLKKKNLDSVVTVQEFRTPIQRSLKITPDKYLKFNNIEFLTSSARNLNTSFFDAGQFYWINVEKILKKKSLFTNKTGAVVLEEMEAQDVNDEVDWMLAEMKYKLTR